MTILYSDYTGTCILIGDKGYIWSSLYLLCGAMAVGLFVLESIKMKTFQPQIDFHKIHIYKLM